MRWPLQPLQPLQKHNSNHLSVHQWIGSATHASQQLTSPIVSYLRKFRHRLVPYYWIYIYIYNTYIHTYTYMHIYVYILYILYICISYLQFILNKSKGRCCWRHRWRRAQKQSRWKGFLIGCFHLFPLRFSRIGKKCKTMFLAMPSRHGRCHAWNKSTTSGSLQCKTWPKLKNIAGTQRWRRTTLVWTNPEIRGCK